MCFGESVRAARRRLNWTQEELAIKLQCTKTAVSKWETNKSIPPLARFKALGEVLEIEPGTLFAYVGPSANGTTREIANLDSLLLAAWQKLSPEQRNKLVKIALLLSQS